MLFLSREERKLSYFLFTEFLDLPICNGDSNHHHLSGTYHLPGPMLSKHIIHILSFKLPLGGRPNYTLLSIAEFW